MVHIEKHKQLLRVRADGALQAEDYLNFTPQLDRLARDRCTPIPVLVELGPDLDGWRLYELWQEVQVADRHRRMFGPVAVVGDARWAVPVRVADGFMDEPVRYFERSDTAQAEGWLRAHATRKSAC